MLNVPVQTGNFAVRTLYVTPEPPYPARSGAALRSWLHISAMAHLGPVAMFSVGGPTEVEPVPGVSVWRHHSTVGRDSTLVRLSATLRRFVRAREFHVADDRLGREISDSLQEFAAAFQPDITVVADWQDAFPAVLHEVGGRIVVDAHNIEHLLQSAMLRKTGKPLLIARSYVREFFARGIERRLFESADEVWLTSSVDQTRLRKMTRNPIRSRVIPNAVDVQKYDCVRDGTIDTPAGIPRQRFSISFVGLFEHLANAHAAELLISGILPRLRDSFPSARLVFVGRGPTEMMLRAAQSDAGVIVTGEVEDTRQYLAACDVSVVPLTSGGGTRFKILEAFAAGIPVVSTSIGAEGLDVRDGRHLFLRESVEGIVEAVSMIWNDSELAKALASEAHGLVSQTYSSHVIREQVSMATAALLGISDSKAATRGAAEHSMARAEGPNSLCSR